MTRNPTSGFWDFAVQFLLGGVVLVLVTLAFYSLRVDLASTAFGLSGCDSADFPDGQFRRFSPAFDPVCREPDLLLCSAVPRVQNRRAAHLIVVLTFPITSVIVTRLIQTVRKEKDTALQAEAKARRNEAYLARAQEVEPNGQLRLQRLYR